MIKQPKYSICMCNYNMSEFLEFSIPSIADQLNDNFEIVIVDDGSNDDSLQNLNKLKEKYNFIKVYNLQRDRKRRLGHTRNISIQKAVGKYVLLFVDCDDIYEKQILNFIETFHFLESNLKKDFLFKGEQINMAKKNFLIKYGPFRNIFYVEDRDLWVRMASLDQLVTIKHRAFRERIKLGTKKKYLKAFIYTFIILKQNFELGTNIFEYIKVTLSSKESIMLKIYKLMICFPLYIISKFSKSNVEKIPFKELNSQEWNLYVNKNFLDLATFCNKNGIRDYEEKLSIGAKELFLNN